MVDNRLERTLEDLERSMGLIEHAELFYELSMFHLKYDHPIVALNFYITSQNLLYMAKEICLGCSQQISTPKLPMEYIEVLKKNVR